MGKTPKILIVDDDAELVQVMSKVLRSKLYEVMVAYNGEEGLQKAKKDKPDLILLDIMMPVRDGFSTTEQFKNDEALSKIPIVAITSVSDVLGRPYEYQFDEYINKPIRPKDLLALVDKYLKKEK